MTESARLALITGSSRGIGKAIAIDLAATGVDILATGRDETRLHNVKKEIEGFGVEAHVVSADLGTDQGINKLHKYLETNDLSVDILVNNAGHDIGGRRQFHEGSVSQWAATIETNVIGLIRVTRVVIDRMVERNTGHIVNIGSVAGIQAYKACAAYAASKHAVHGLSLIHI